MNCNHYSSNSFHAIVMPFDIPDHSEVFSVPKKKQIPKIAFWSFSVHVFTSSSVRLLHHGKKFYNHYSSNSFHPIVVPFGILDQSEVFSVPKKNQKKKTNFGLFLNSIWIPCWFENRSEIHRFDEFRKGCRSFANRRGLWTTLFRTYFIERNKRLRRNSRMYVFSTISIQQDRTAFIDSNPSKPISIACW